MRGNYLAADGRDINDASSLSLTHFRENRISSVQRCPEMQLHQIVVVLDRQYVHWPHKVGACVVNQDVDLTEAIAHLLHHPVNLGAIGHITGNTQNLSTALL